MILVVADDLTGAAELGGAAVSRGLETFLVRRPPWPNLPDSTKVLCVDTDTREMPPAAAAALVERVVRELPRRWSVSVYKKVDSVLRGAVLAEVEAMRRVLGFQRAILLPANPSRGRVIRHGAYFIDGVPLHQTEFARDPHHPRWSHEVLTLLAPLPETPVVVRTLTEPLPAEGIVVAEASSAAEVRAWAEQCTAETLAAGGLDFFTAWLERALEAGVPQLVSESDCHTNPEPAATPGSTRWPGSGSRLLLVSGTSSPRAADWMRESREAGMAVFSLGEVVERSAASASSLEETVAGCCRALASGWRAVLCPGPTLGPVPRRSGGVVDLHLLASVAGAVLERGRPDLVLLEGGATAAALMDRFPWSCWRVEREWGPGVVELHPAGRPSPVLLVKPGSYPWPSAVRALWFASLHKPAPDLRAGRHETQLGG